VDFVDNVNLEARAAGAILNVAAQFANFLDRVVAGTVDFQDVDVVAAGDGFTVFAFVAGCGGRSLLAVQGLGQDASRAGFANAAGPGEEVSVGDPVLLQGIDESLRDMLLAHQIGKALRPIASGQDGVAFVRFRGGSRFAFRHGIRNPQSRHRTPRQGD